MRDPFPASPTLSTFLSTPFHSLSLSAIPLHIHEILAFALLYHILCFYISPRISRALFNQLYTSFDYRTRLNWDVHVTSLIQSTLISSLGFYIVIYDDARNAMDWRARVYGYDGGLGMVAALAAGYFLWDLWLSATYAKLFGPGLLAHAASALAVYLFGFRPVVMYYGPVFILFELSSPFLNFHWFLDKLKMTGSTLQLLNGILLMTTFAGSRLIWGGYNCFRVFPDLWKALQYQKTKEGMAWLAEEQAKAAIDAAATAAMAAGSATAEERMELLTARLTAPKALPEWVAGVYVVAYVVLMVLNVFWFWKMVETLRARFEPPLGTKRVETKKEEKDGEVVKSEISGGRGRTQNGGTVVELEETEVRARKTKRRG